MTDLTKIVGAFPDWAKELRQTGTQSISRSEAANIAVPTHDSVAGEVSWNSQRGAAELLGLSSPAYKLGHLLTVIESVQDYWHGKMYTLRADPGATAQFIQDELEFNLTNIPIHPSCSLPPLDADLRDTYAVLRPLITNFNCYIYALEMKEALDRIDALEPSTVKTGGLEMGKHIEWIRHLSKLLVEETKVSLRLLWAGGPGEDLVKLSLDKSWSESTNVSREMKLLLNKPLEEIELDNAFEAAFAGLALNPDERDNLYGDSLYTQMLAFEQAMLEEKDLGRRYPYSLQMCLGEYALAIELLSALPPPTSPAVEPYQPKTLAVRLNIAQSASTQICTALPFVKEMCNANSAFRNSPQLWESHREIRGIFAKELNLPQELISKLFPAMEDVQETARWRPIDEFNQPMKLIDGKWESVTDTDRSADQSRIFRLGKREYDVWKSIFRGIEFQLKANELRHLFKCNRFNVENVGGSFIRFTPPQNAGIPFIIRAPVTNRHNLENSFRMPSLSVGELVHVAYGWTMDWFELKTGEGEIDENDSGNDDMFKQCDDLDHFGGCKDNAYVFDLTGRVLAKPYR
ncbi:uncharacterized protein L201_005285 [Kwoniella dendrophila CBS 6074]|uniref:Uncharacterized protein n=1 Tax=Kwoniella dendrophila CBS 6074 TaxID=1295534 RepID=A0AAX4JYL4_9TREE